MLRRSVLYLPASNARAIEKARSLPCDAIILDLEDGVAPEAKETARQQAVSALTAGGFGHREVVVRVNGLETPWGIADCRALSEVLPDAILMPKIASADSMNNYRALVGHETTLWAMIETCGAILRLDAIAQSTKAIGVSVLVVGTNDLQIEMGCQAEEGREALKPALCFAVMAARAYGLSVLDGVFNDLSDEDGFTRQCKQAAALGFDGKTLLHPKQIAVANRAFVPGVDEVSRAAAIVTAFEAEENAAKGAILVNGRMVERLHLEQARRILAIGNEKTALVQ